jgi:hypothetical protein
MEIFLFSQHIAPEQRWARPHPGKSRVAPQGRIEKRAAGR